MIDKLQERYEQECQKRGCYCKPFHLALSEYANTPEYLRAIIIANEVPHLVDNK
jgi:hypothetical protein